ncbi:hypothetical protein N825_25310 [Skermanella stibiiresistens SB22]|uniref:Uncharacterized protein n=1 Tax=Skermanella stibiiresistens SB22 TaxID=1385369 RepID=W9GS90_9PROT|nr:hypothetical protein [Skermanella stibiiresistens]EWY36755.1 hypothetical protein N825_25310 [Skermanella stibiiresistens SB22]
MTESILEVNPDMFDRGYRAALEGHDGAGYQFGSSIHLGHAFGRQCLAARYNAAGCGAAARLEGLPRTINPWVPDTPSWDHWDHAWSVMDASRGEIERARVEGIRVAGMLERAE